MACWLLPEGRTYYFRNLDRLLEGGQFRLTSDFSRHFTSRSVSVRIYAYRRISKFAAISTWFLSDAICGSLWQLGIPRIGFGHEFQIDPFLFDSRLTRTNHKYRPARRNVAANVVRIFCVAVLGLQTILLRITKCRTKAQTTIPPILHRWNPN